MIYDLNSLVPSGSPHIEDARAINNDGVIVAYGDGRALLLVPLHDD
jgi:hypothetical protein